MKKKLKAMSRSVEAMSLKTEAKMDQSFHQCAVSYLAMRYVIIQPDQSVDLGMLITVKNVLWSRGAEGDTSLVWENPSRFKVLSILFQIQSMHLRHFKK